MNFTPPTSSFIVPNIVVPTSEPGAPYEIYGVVRGVIEVTIQEFFTDGVIYADLLLNLPSATFDSSGQNMITATLPVATGDLSGQNVIEGAIPPMTSVMSGGVGQIADVLLTLPAMSGTLVRDEVFGTVIGALIPLTSRFVKQGDEFAIAATLPAMQASADIYVYGYGSVAATLTPLFSTFVGGQTTFSPSLPSVTGSIDAAVVPYGSIGASLPTMTVDTYAVSANFGGLVGRLAAITTNTYALLGQYASIDCTLTSLSPTIDAVPGRSGNIDGQLPALLTNQLAYSIRSASIKAKTKAIKARIAA